MTQEENLLLKDLSARIFYGTRVKVSNIWDEDKEIEKDIVDSLYCVLPDGYINTSTIDSDIPIKDVKPYLRSMSSMTNEEKEELEDIFNKNDNPCTVYKDGCLSFYGGNDFLCPEDLDIYIDFCNQHHFDYRGLIHKGLALEAPEDMYK